MNSLAISTFPLLYFFSFLYYTDAGGVFFVLLSYLLCLKKRVVASAIFIAWSIMFRQTNVVWVLYLAAVTGVDNLTTYVQKKMDQSCKDGMHALVIITAKDRMQGLAISIWLVLRNVIPYILVCLGFIGFVFWNNGVALGDRSAHVAVFHVPQLFYFSLFTSALTASQLLTYLPGMLKSLTKRKLILMMLLATFIWFGVKYYTIEHLYLISDNRHYTFYIWMKLIRKYWFARYCLIVPYTFAIFLLVKAFKDSSGDRLLTLAFIICTAINLVPQALVEFRYFIIPFLIFRSQLSVKCQSLPLLISEIISNSIVNFLTIYLFLYRPFLWPHDPTNVQRFMW